MSLASRLSLTLLSAALIPVVHADTASPTVDPRIEQLLTELGKSRSIARAQLSPDGKAVAWTLSGEGRTLIEIADIDGHNVRHIGRAGPGVCSQTDVTWAPDSHRIAFLSDCGDKDKRRNLFVVDTKDLDNPRQIAPLRGLAANLAWTNDGRSIGFLFVENATRRSSATAAAKPQIGEIGVDGVEVQRVAAVDANGSELRFLTGANQHVYEFSWSPDGSRIAFVSAPPPGDNNWWVSKLWVQGTQAGAQPSVAVDPATTKSSLRGLQMALPRWSPDGSRIAFIGGLMSDQGATGGDIYSVSSQGGEPVNLTPDTKVSPVWLAWNGNNQMIVSQVSNGQAQVAEYAVTAQSAKPTRTLFTVPASIGAGGDAMALSLSDDRKSVAFVKSSYEAAPEVHAGALGNTPPSAITKINAGLKPQWGKAESIEWDNEGKHVQGWLLYPANYDPSKRYPMIVTVHGGPASAVMPRWPGVGFGGVPFSALGYFVFMPNPRGSHGQGEAFVQANRKDFGYGDLRDTLAGIDAIEKRLPVDDKRLGLTGWSYGGFMSMFAPTQTQRFRAVVAGAGIANWQSYYGQNLIDQWMIPFFGASVYDDPAVYAKSSAINFIKKTTAPTLVVVGDRDAECPAAQSLEFWHALRAQGVPTSLVIYPNEGHHFVNPAHQKDVLQRALEWFGKYLPAN
ncbi:MULTISPECIES: S9 family peptidase [Dyella]|uniref:S9 family peptidase n=2 Tax=Dyella TaxID=231454 RepID=A0A4R0YR59_9GAMM|nr:MULTISPECIES: S9 family peptidase [Dyella]TBR35847.1 S9 family peptidase [Dyella terrae]TCI08605.1 S9 family peptidase [Dyella soli]